MVDCTGLENRQRETVREFESHRFRQSSNEYAPFGAFCFVSTLLPTGLFPAGYADSVDLELDLIGKEGCIGMGS